MFEQLRRRDDTCLERRSADDALRSTSFADRDLTKAIRCTLELPRQAKGSHIEENSHFKKYSQVQKFGLIWTDFDSSPFKLRKHFSF